MDRLTSKLILQGEIINISPLVIGSNKGGLVDVELIKNEIGDFYIPATSFKGTLKHYLLLNFKKRVKNLVNKYLGSEESEGIFIIQDLKAITSMNITVRDGIAIDQTKGVSKEGAKFNYEILEPNTRFKLEIEIAINDSINEGEVNKFLKTIIEELNEGHLRIGAMNTKGYGKIKLDKFSLFEFNFPTDGGDWFNYLINKSIDPKLEISLKDYDSYEYIKNDKCIFKISFQIKSSLIIGATPSNPNDPDKIHILSNGIPVLTGTSIKGALKARAIKIINTLGGNGDEMLRDLFGWIDLTNKSKTKYKSRVILNDEVIENVNKTKHNRIKIDRFTGGTIMGALFSSQPLWHENEKINITLSLKQAKEWEIGLLLQVFKDLWNEDLPIGGEINVGRGLLIGDLITIIFNNEKFEISKNKEILAIVGDKNKLENFSQALINEIGDGKNEK